MSRIYKKSWFLRNFTGYILFTELRISKKSASTLLLCYSSIFSITLLSDRYLRCMLRWAPPNLALQPADPSHEFAVFKGKREPQIAWADCLSVTGYITLHFLTSVWSPVLCVGTQASHLELAVAVAFGSGTEWLSTLAGGVLCSTSKWNLCGCSFVP